MCYPSTEPAALCEAEPPLGWCPLKVERSGPKVRASGEVRSCLPLKGSSEEVLNGCLAKTKGPFISFDCYFHCE